MSREALKSLVVGLACGACSAAFDVVHVRALGIEDGLAFAAANCAGCGAQELLAFPESRLLTAVAAQLGSGPISDADLAQVRELLAEFGDSAGRLMTRLTPA